MKYHANTARGDALERDILFLLRVYGRATIPVLGRVLLASDTGIAHALARLQATGQIVRGPKVEQRNGRPAWTYALARQQERAA